MATTTTTTTKRVVRSGYITCGICKSRAVQGKITWGFFCPNVECRNSEAEFLKD